MIYLKPLHDISLAFLMATTPATIADVQKQDAAYEVRQESRLAQKAIEAIESKGKIIIEGKGSELESYKTLRFGKYDENLAILKKGMLKVMVLENSRIDSYIDVGSDGSLDLLIQQTSSLDGNILRTTRKINAGKETVRARQGDYLQELYAICERAQHRIQK